MPSMMGGLPEPMTYGATHDLIVVVPGIMGSALKDRDSGRLVWGFAEAKWWVDAWNPMGQGLTPLALTDAELEALHGGGYEPSTARIKPAGLLHGPIPAFAPILGGIEPYTRLVKELKKAVIHEAAALEFAYDWRLPTAFNSQLLDVAIRCRLKEWRKHEKHAEGRRLHPEQRDAQVVIVAHSMGGLVAQGLGTITGALDNVRQVITLGTPFYGAVAALSMLETGEAPPVSTILPRTRLRDVARTMPGVYDLLPRLRCLLVPSDEVGEDVIAVTPGHVAAIGASRDLAQAAADRFQARKDVRLPQLQAHVGTHQPTAQSARIEHGHVIGQPHYYKFGADGVIRDDRIGQPVRFTDGEGDGTVPWRSARPLEHDRISYRPQQHGALASSGESIKAIVSHVKDEPVGDRLGRGDIGIEVPDVVLAGQPVEIRVTGEADPARVTCQITDLGDPTGRAGRQPKASRRGEDLVAEAFLGPGLYRVAAKLKAGGRDAVSQVVLVMESE
ncbi:MAG: hypothetical protein QM619_00865 [Micropruina sp.]|uniref:lipase/acyltransferase domain-containing protein n=1 Tax=Micropruina sp. TaxID=2737536 RepID=UPI0039E4EB56